MAYATLKANLALNSDAPWAQNVELVNKAIHSTGRPITIAASNKVGGDSMTTSCSLDFMRKPKAGVDLIATAKLLKLGRQLSVSHVLLYSEGMEAPVAQATMTYAIPPVAMG